MGLGNWVPGSAPRVHAGFLTTWQKNGLSERLVERLCQIVSTRRDSPDGVKIYITGGEALQVTVPTVLPTRCGISINRICMLA